MGMVKLVALQLRFKAQRGAARPSRRLVLIGNFAQLLTNFDKIRLNQGNPQLDCARNLYPTALSSE